MFNVSKMLPKNEMVVSLGVTFIARGIAALGSIFLAVIIGRTYGAEGMGVFAIAQSLLLGAAILARMGMDNSLIKYVGHNPKAPDVIVYLRWSITRATIFSLLLSVVFFVMKDFIEGFFKTQGLAGVMIGVVLAVPAFTYGFLLSGFFKGALKPAIACLLENGVVSLFVGLLVLGFSYVRPGSSISVVGYAYALGAWLVIMPGFYIAWHMLKVNKLDRNVPTFSGVTYTQFKSTSNAFYISSMAGFLQAVVSIMVAAWLLDEYSLGLFKAAHQVAFVISFILIVINAIFPARYAKMFHEGELHKLERLAKLSSLCGVVLSAPAVLLCLIAPGWVLSWFGQEFSSAAVMLQIMVVAQFINVATGSVGFLLNMTGFERYVRNISLVCNSLGLLSFYFLIKYFGAMGAAIAVSLVVIFQNLLFFYFVWKKLGIWAMPVPFSLKRQ